MHSLVVAVVVQAKQEIQMVLVQVEMVLHLQLMEPQQQELVEGEEVNSDLILLGVVQAVMVVVQMVVMAQQTTQAMALLTLVVEVVELEQMVLVLFVEVVEQVVQV